MSGVSDGDPVLANGNSVTSLADASGNGNAAMVGLSASPVYLSTSFNGNPSIYMDGGILKMDFTSGVSIRTMFLVAGVDSCNCGGAHLGGSTGTCGSAPANYLWSMRDSSNSWEMVTYLNYNQDGAGQPWQDATKYLNGVTGNSVISTSGPPCNELSVAGGFILSLVFTAPLDAKFFALFGNPGGGEYSRTLFAELRAYDSALSVSERQKIECDLGSKWGITLDASVACA